MLTNVTVSLTQSARTFRQSLTVVTFSNSAGVGATAGAAASSGAQSAALTTTKAGSLVFGVGFDWDRAVSRTIGAGQARVHQWVDTASGATFWVHNVVAPIASAGVVVQMNNPAPTNDRWDLSIVEIIVK